MIRENKKNSSFMVWIVCKTKEDLKKLIANKGLTVSELVNNILIEKLERESLKKKNYFNRRNKKK